MKEVNLDNCHLEPIHIPGSIQSHGFLLVVDPDSLLVRHASLNCQQVFSVEINAILGKPLSEFLPEALLDSIKGAKGAFHTINPLLFKTASEHSYDLIVSRNEKYLLLTFEEVFESQAINFETRYYHMRNFLNEIVEIDSLTSVFDQVAVEVRNITGFDRVMVYRFDEQYNGEVIAEAKKTELNSFLRQHFPESDIPAQARALYVKNRIRILANVDAKTEPLYPNDEDIDLSNSSLRSVSPIHCQYLRNMGVVASMSISLTIGDKLWGLIACHHYSPRTVSFLTRETAAYLGLTLSHYIAVRAREKQSTQEAKTQAILAAITSSITSEINYIDGLDKASGDMMSLVEASGMAVCLEGNLSLYGEIPEQEQVYDIYEWYMQQAEVNEAMFYTHHLTKDNPDFARLSDTASGVLLVRLSLSEKEFIIWFRKEIILTKNWGGKPEKVIEFLDDGSHRLMPRSSFALWKENVRDQSEPWTQVDRVSVLALRNAIVNYVLRRSEEVRQQNEQLQRRVDERTKDLRNEVLARVEAESQLQLALKQTKESNEQLEKFAYVASHDLQEPLRKIQSFGSRLEDALETYDNPNVQQYLIRMISAANRMQILIKDLLSFSRVNRSEKLFEVELNTLLNEVLSDIEVLINEKSAIIEFGELGKVLGDRSQLYRLLQNLLQNAIKFSSPDSKPKITVQCVERLDDGVVYEVKDNGIGFDMRYKDKVFELFQRLHGRSAYEGTGLGLAISKKIMERHGGSIWAESKLGSGTSIFVKFPHWDAAQVGSV